MSSARRAWSQAYRAFILIRANSFRLLDVSVWPFVLLMSTLLFAGFVTASAQVVGVVVLGALGWRVLYHFQMEPVQGIMDEHWDHSLEHLMMSPVRVREILFGGMVSALAKSLVVGAMFLAVGHFLFGLAIPSWLALLPALLAVIVCGVILALFSLGVAFLKGNESYGFIWAITDVVAVLSGVFYPTSVFPGPLRAAVQALPTTHAFDMLKSLVGVGSPDLPLFAITAAAWLALAALFCGWAFRRAKRQGKLVRMK